MAWVEALGPWGPPAVLVLLALEAVVAPLPGIPLVVGTGLVWGPAAGFLLSWAGGWIGSVLAFAIARRWLREPVWARLSPQQRRFVEELGRRHGFALLVLARWLPFTSVDWIAYAAGISGVPFPTYAAATAVGLVPGTAAYVLVGHSLAGLRRLEWLLAGAALLVAAAYVAARVLRSRGREGGGRRRA